MNNKQRREETRSAILSAATVCFSSGGFDGSGVAEICSRAGVSKGAFYYHFQSKEAVFLELLNTWLSGLEHSLEEAAGDAATIPESLMRMAGIMQGVLQADRKRIAIFLELWTQASRHEHIRQATIAPYHKYQEILAQMIGRGIEEGTLDPIDPVSGAQVIISLASGIFLQALLDPDGADWGKVLQDSIQIILDGIKRR